MAYYQNSATLPTRGAGIIPAESRATIMPLTRNNLLWVMPAKGKQSTFLSTGEARADARAFFVSLEFLAKRNARTNESSRRRGSILTIM